MVFDYEKEMKNVVKTVDILNLNGRNQVKSILEYLQVCPFFEVVAEHLNITVSAIYFKLKYYLGEEAVKKLNDDIKERRKKKMESYKLSMKKILEIMDANKNVEDENTDGGD
jgi:sulfite reductase alpha subunit-like flavoprotein